MADLEQLIRDALREAAGQAEPSDDGLARIWDRIQEADCA